MKFIVLLHARDRNKCSLYKCSLAVAVSVVLTNLSSTNLHICLHYFDDVLRRTVAHLTSAQQMSFVFRKIWPLIWKNEWLNSCGCESSLQTNHSKDIGKEYCTPADGSKFYGRNSIALWVEVQVSNGLEPTTATTCDHDSVAYVGLCRHCSLTSHHNLLFQIPFRMRLQREENERLGS